MSENKFVIHGKEIDYGEMSEDMLLKLYTELKQRELKLYEIAKKLESEITYLKEIN